MPDKQTPDQNSAKIEFPCEGYPIKALGVASIEYTEAVLAIMDRHAPGYDKDRVKVTPSGKGTFHSCTVYITATGEDQLRDIFEELKSHPSTRMVL